MGRHRFSFIIAAVSAIILAVLAPASYAVQYKLHVLDMLPGGTYGAAYDVNSSLTVVGLGNTYKVVSWDSTGAHDLKWGYGGLDNVAINDAGSIVASYKVWSNGTWTELTDLTGSVGNSSGSAINSAGAVVGASSIDIYGNTHACLWDSTGAHDLGSLNPAWSSKANGINDSGQIVGVSGITGFIYDHGSMTSLGAPTDCNNSTAWRINNNGQVIGTSGYNGGKRAWVWQAGNWTVFGQDHLYTYAMDINDAGQVVGYYSGAQYSAFIWQNGTMTTLPGLGFDTYAYGINKNGWIVGRSESSTDGRYYAVLWEPVPEPSTLAALLSGLGGLCALLRKRRV